MKTCVFITGTNAVGKSALAWAIIDRYGGVDRITNDATYCKTGSISLAGKYGVTRYGGVDRITNENGSSCTSRLADVVEEALRNAEVVICEGSFMNTFGLNLTNAMFKAQRYLVVSLYCPPQLIYERLTARSNGRNGKRNFELIWKKQRQAMIAARRWQERCVRYSDIRKDIDALHSYDWGRACGYNANSSERRAKFMDMSMAEYLRWLWNNPQAGQSPYTLFEGALVPQGKDADGNIIYHYNGAKF